MKPSSHKTGWGGRPKLLPGSRDKGYQRPKPTLIRSKGHQRDWLDACKGGPAAGSNFEYGAALTEVGLLGLVAMRVGKRLSMGRRGHAVFQRSRNGQGPQRNVPPRLGTVCVN
jgi:hypothetical protein